MQREIISLSKDHWSQYVWGSTYKDFQIFYRSYEYWPYFLSRFLCYKSSSYSSTIPLKVGFLFAYSCSISANVCFSGSVQYNAHPSCFGSWCQFFLEWRHLPLAAICLGNKHSHIRSRLLSLNGNSTYVQIKLSKMPSPTVDMNYYCQGQNKGKYCIWTKKKSDQNGHEKNNRQLYKFYYLIPSPPLINY